MEGGVWEKEPSLHHSGATGNWTITDAYCVDIAIYKLV